jgi:hypothetical protein
MPIYRLAILLYYWFANINVIMLQIITMLVLNDTAIASISIDLPVVAKLLLAAGPINIITPHFYCFNHPVPIRALR